MRQALDLLGQQAIGALQLFVAEQKMLHTFGNLIDQVVVGHGSMGIGRFAIVGVLSPGQPNRRLGASQARKMCSVGARGPVHGPQFNGKQEGVPHEHT